MTELETLTAILTELQKLTDAETGILAVFDDGIRTLLGAAIAIVVVHALESFFLK